MTVSTCLQVLCLLAAGILEAASVAFAITPNALPIASRVRADFFTQSPDAEALNTESGIPTEKLEQLNKIPAMEDTPHLPSELLRASMDSLHGGMTDAVAKEPLSSGLSVTQQIHQELDDFTERLNKTDASGLTSAATKAQPVFQELTELAKRLSVHVEEMKQKNIVRKQHQDERLARLNASAQNSTDRTNLLATIHERNLGLKKEFDRLKAKEAATMRKEQPQLQDALSATQFEAEAQAEAQSQIHGLVEDQTQIHNLAQELQQERSQLRDPPSSGTHFKIAMIITFALVLCVLKVVDTGMRRRQKSAALNQQLHNELSGKHDSF